MSETHPTIAAVELVKELRACRDQVEGWLRSMRLGSGMTFEPTKVRLFRWKRGHGYPYAPATDVPRSMQSEFYVFLQEKSEMLRQRIKDAEAALPISEPAVSGREGER